MPSLNLSPRIITSVICFLCCLYGFTKIEAQNKDVILVLDESASMNGNKWESVTYAMQFVTALLDESDNLYIIRHRSNGVNNMSLSKKQGSINEIKRFVQSAEGSHAPVIQQAVDQMKKNPHRKKILLFYGDGLWGSDIKSACQDLISQFPKYKPDLHFLKVEDNQVTLGNLSIFEQETNALSLMNVIPTNPDNKGELIRNLQSISKKIAGIDENDVKFNLDGKHFSFDVKFPLKKILIINQSETAKTFAKLDIVSMDGSPQLKVFQTLNMGSKILHGKYFEIRDEKESLIPAKQKIKITFNEPIDQKNILIIPIVAAKVVTKIASEDVLSSDATKNEYIVCDDTKSITLNSLLEDTNGNRITNLDGVDIVAKINKKQYHFKNNKSIAECTIPISQDTSYISVEAKYQGYFHQKDYIFTIIKKNCQPRKDTVPIDLGNIPFIDFNRIGHCVGITYSFNDELVSPQNYRLKLEGVPFGVTYTIDSTGNAFMLCFKKSPYVCDCMVPSGDLSGTIIAVPKSDTLLSASKAWTFHIVKEENIFLRCKRCLLLLITLICILTYVYGVIRKPRFHSTAKFEVYEVDKMATYAPNNKKPRKKLPTGIVSRYIIPFIPETKMVDRFKVIATPNKSVVMIAKESLSERMSKNGEPINPKSKKDLKLFRNNTLEIEKTPTVTTIYTFKVK